MQYLHLMRYSHFSCNKNFLPLLNMRTNTIPTCIAILIIPKIPYCLSGYSSSLLKIIPIPIMWSSYSTPTYLPRLRIIIAYAHIKKDSNFSTYSQKAVSTWMSINMWVDKLSVIYPCNRTLHQKKRNYWYMTQHGQIIMLSERSQTKKKYMMWLHFIKLQEMKTNV